MPVFQSRKPAKTTKITLVILLLLGFVVSQYLRKSFEPSSSHSLGPVDAFQQHLSDVQITGRGTVIKLFKDDLQGDRHQKFLLKVASQQTLLVAHNIDIAPRVDSLEKGDEVGFSGEYIWNDKGGLLHWTHHDPKGRHPSGWLHHHGKTYQ
jgi:hypothetical protein